MSLLKQVKEAKREAFAEAKATAAWVWGRGAAFITVDAKGERCRPFDESGAFGWDGTMKDVKLALEKAAQFPEVAEVWVQGGYDGGDRATDKEDGNYEPMIATWEVRVK